MKKILLSLSVLMLLCVPMLAQIDLPKPNFSVMPASGRSLFDRSRVSMSHSMGFEAGASSRGGYYLSRYTNHLKYNISPKLDLKLDLSVVNYGSSSTSFKINDDNKSRIIPSFSLDYNPTDKIKIQFNYRQGYPVWERQDPWYDRDF